MNISFILFYQALAIFQLIIFDDLALDYSLNSLLNLRQGPHISINHYQNGQGLYVGRVFLVNSIKAVQTRSIIQVNNQNIRKVHRGFYITLVYFQNPLEILLTLLEAEGPVIFFCKQ